MEDPVVTVTVGREKKIPIDDRLIRCRRRKIKKIRTETLRLQLVDCLCQNRMSETDSDSADSCISVHFDIDWLE